MMANKNFEKCLIYPLQFDILNIESKKKENSYRRRAQKARLPLFRLSFGSVNLGKLGSKHEEDIAEEQRQGEKAHEEETFGEVKETHRLGGSAQGHCQHRRQ